MLNVVHDDEARAVAVGQEAEGGVEGEAGDGGGRLAVDPGGEAHQVSLVTRGLLHLPSSHLPHRKLVPRQEEGVSFKIKKGFFFNQFLETSCEGFV